jgi:PmbA protein
MTEVTLAPCLGADRAQAALDEAVAAAQADQVEAFLATRSATMLRFAGARVHQPQDLGSIQVMVRAVVGHSAARAATSSLSGVGRAVEAACAQARALASAAAGRAPTAPAHPPAQAVPAPADVGMWSPETVAWDVDVRSDQIRRAVQLATRHGAEICGAFGTAATELAVANSLGVRRYAAATEASISMTAQLGGGSAHREDLGRVATDLRVEEVVEAIVADAVRMSQPQDVRPGRYDVVFGPLAAGELVSFLPAFGFTAPALRAGVGVAARRSRTFSPLVTIADDATEGPGLPFPFDMEGTSRRRVGLIVGGQVCDVVSDLASAEVTNGSTGHAHIAREESPAPVAANLRLEPRSGTTADLVSRVARGVYVERLWYTRLLDAETGTIAGTTRDAAWQIEEGRLTGPLRGTRFSESVLDALERTDAVGEQVVTHPLMNVWNGCVSAPPIRVRGFRLGLPRADEAERETSL